MFIKANAKINVFLDVVSSREDQYHNLDMVMLPIELHDMIEIEKLPSTRDTYVVCDHVELKETKYNLIMTTINVMKEKYGIKDNFDVKVHKEIPICAGLGGGSSNAAATIKALNTMYKLNMSLDEMINIGKTIGADIPFCLTNSPARVTGIGENIRRIKLHHGYDVLIVKPDEGLSTKKMFALADELGVEHSNGDEVENALVFGNDTKLSECVFNSLEKIAISQIPEIEKIKNMLKNDGFKIVLMSGSGSAVFALTKKHKKARTMFKKYDKQGFNTYLTRTL